MRSSRTTSSLLLLLAAPASLLAQERPDPRTLEARAAATRTRLEKDPAEWRLDFSTQHGSRVVVDVLHTPVGTRRILSIQPPAKPLREMLRIVERPDAWYVTEVEGVRGIYRPWEAPFTWTEACQYLPDSGLLTVRRMSSLGRYVETRVGLGTFRQPLSEGRRLGLERLLRQMRAALGKQPHLRPRLGARIAQAERALAEGITCQVELSTGILRRYGPPERRARLVSFRWLKTIDLTAFLTTGPRLPDRRGPLAADRPGDLVMIAHNGSWKQGTRPHGLDARLLDLRSGALRRVPYRGQIALPGCFLKGRRSVVVCGADEGGMGLYRIDLDTGRNHRLGRRPLSWGVCMAPALSPDGKTVAVLHLSSPRTPRAQVYLVDVATGRARPLGEPLVANRVSWLPDGLDLILARRTLLTPDAPPLESIVRMDLLRGRTVALREGSSPVVVAGSQAILFRDRKGWRLCDLGGKNPRPVGDGLADCGSPAPAPTGARVILLRSRPTGPQPVVVELDTGQATPVRLPKELARGLWAFPAWR